MNINVLAGYACPSCGSEGPFRMLFNVRVACTVSDDGYVLADADIVEDYLDDPDYDPSAECLDCEFCNSMDMFKTGSFTVTIHEETTSIYKVAAHNSTQAEEAALRDHLTTRDPAAFWVDERHLSCDSVAPQQEKEQENE